MIESRFYRALVSPVWAVLAWQDIVARYRRSTLGPFWITVTTAVFVLGVGTLYGSLFGKQTADYMLYLGTGYILWQFLAAVLVEGSTALTSDREMLLNSQIDPQIIILRIVARNAITFAHSLPVYVALLLYAQPPLSHIPLALPGAVLLLLNAMWMAVVVGIAGARFRDIPPILGALIQLLFLLTPILWAANSGVVPVAFTWFNPFTHLLAAARDPLIGHPFPVASLLISFCIAVLGLLAAAYLSSRAARRIPYWL
jgi:ABC-type polysaccharide/polyol phosphate export permease